MERNELLKKVRKIEIKAKGLSQNIFAGEYHSAFKGRGMTFSEVREYQYGDDVRDIDWNGILRHCLYHNMTSTGMSLRDTINHMLRYMRKSANSQ